MTTYRSLRSLAGRIARTPAARGANRLIAAAGFDALSRACARYTRYAPELVSIPLPNLAGGAPLHIRMHSGGGNDNVAFEAWRLGFYNYEPPFPCVYLALIQRAEVVFGIGANSGLYELAAAACRPAMRIFAFEPFPEAFAALTRNVALNHMDTAIQPVNQATAECSGVLHLYVPAKTHGALLETSASLNPDFRPAHSAVLEVPSVTLDEFSRTAQIRRIDLIRIDVESAEHRVLLGAGHALHAFRPFVILEVLENADIECLESIRQQYRYAIFAADGGGLREMPRIAYQPASDNQVLCPKERIDEFVRSLQSASIPVAPISPARQPQ